MGAASAPLASQLRQPLAQIAFARGQMAELDAELGRMVGGSPVLTAPGVGTVCAAAILGEHGDVPRFGDASKALAFALCDPSVSESGEFVGSRARMSKRGSPYLRWAPWVAADRARTHDPAMRAYCQKKRSEGKRHEVAVSAVVRELVSVIHAVMRDGTAYVCPAAWVLMAIAGSSIKTKGCASISGRSTLASAMALRKPATPIPRGIHMFSIRDDTSSMNVSTGIEVAKEHPANTSTWPMSQEEGGRLLEPIRASAPFCIATARRRPTTRTRSLLAYILDMLMGITSIFLIAPTLNSMP